VVRILAGLTILACSIGTALFLMAKQPPRGSRPSSPFAVGSMVQSELTALVHSIPPSATTTVVDLVLPEPHRWSHSLCPRGMAWIGGSYCPRSRSEDDKTTSCASDERSVAACMDPHEYPSQVGVLPAVMLDFRSATEACKAEGKRLCTETEWAFACQSTLEPTACNTGRTELRVRTQELANAERVSAEIAAHDGRRPSGENECVSGFRVFDLLGNVQEWVTSEHQTPHVGALKGGRYNQSSIGCGRSIYVSDPWTRYPHTGLRCCADPLAPVPTSP
jgi:Sulfatase-modifying factor enzyme 1